METLFYSITDGASRLNAISAEPRIGASLRRSNSFFPDGIRFERSPIETALKLAAMVIATIGILMATSLFTSCDALDPEDLEEDEAMLSSGTIITTGQLSYQAKVEGTSPDSYSIMYIKFKAPMHLAINYGLYYAVKENPEMFSSGMSSLDNISALLQSLGYDPSEMMQGLSGYEDIINAAYPGVQIAWGGNYNVITNAETGEQELDMLNTLPVSIGNSGSWRNLNCSGRMDGYLSETYGTAVAAIYMKPEGNKFKYSIAIQDVATVGYVNGQPILFTESWVNYVEYCKEGVYRDLIPGTAGLSGLSALLQNVNINNPAADDYKEYFDANRIEIPAEDMERFLADPAKVGLRIPLDVSQTVEEGNSKSTITITGWSGHNAELPEVECELTTKAEYMDWLPEGGNSETEPGKEKVHITVNLYKAGSEKKERPVQKCKQFKIYLHFTTKEPGVCNNFPLNGKEDYDLRIAPDESKLTVEADGQSATSIKGEYQLEFDIESFDYGAYAELEVIAEMENGEQVQAYINGNRNDHYLEIPRDDNDNLIGDKWEEQFTDNSIDWKNPMWDEENFPAGQRLTGDGYTLYEEYRGFKTETGQHRRTSPEKKDLFVLDFNGLINKYYGKDNSYDNIASLTLHFLSSEIVIGKNGIVNFNSSRFKYANQHYLFVNVGEVEGDDVGDTRGNFSFASNGQVLKHVTEVVIDLDRIDESLRPLLTQHQLGSMPPNLKALRERIVKETVAHEIDHALSIKHHHSDANGNGTKEQMTSGVIGCVMRYQTESEYKSVVYISSIDDFDTSGFITGDRYCEEDDNCWRQINVKMYP